MKKLTLMWLAALLLLAGAQGLFPAAAAGQAITSIEQLNDKAMKVGVGTGSISEDTVKRELPNATIVYFDDKFMAYEAVAQGKIDAYVYDLRQMELSIRNGQAGVRLLDETMRERVNIAVGISSVSKIPQLEDRINRFIAEMRADGTLDEMFDRWVIRGEETMPDIALPSSPKYHLTVGTTGIVPPYSYYVGSTLNGYDIELARRFAAWLDADLEFGVYDYGAILPATQSGKIDCIMANLQVSKERAENFRFSDTLFVEQQGVMVRDSGSPDTGSPGSAARGAQIRLADLNAPDVKVGLPLSSAADVAVREQLPLAQAVHYNDNMLGCLDVAQGRIDAFVYDEVQMKLLLENGLTGVRMLDEYMDRQLKICVGISPVSKIPNLEGKVNRFIAEMKQSGTIEDMRRRWVWDAQRALPEIELPENPQYHLTVATSGVVMPFSYYEGDALTGMDIETAYRFAQWLGADLEFKVYDYGAIVPAAVSGKVDVIMANLQYTPERADSGLIFSDELYPGRNAILVRDDAQQAGGAIVSMASLHDKRIGVTTGSVQAIQAESWFPDAQILFFSTSVDMLNALKARKIDAFIDAEPLVKSMMGANPELTCLDERPGEVMQVGAIFPKTEEGEALRDAFSAFIREIRQNGVYDEIVDTWFGEDEAKRAIPDLDDLPATNGTLRMAVDASLFPFVYVKDGKPVGLEVDTAVRFCKAHGYGLEVVQMDFAAIIPAVVAGKVDFAGSGIAYTPERAESVLYSDFTYEGSSVIAVLKSEQAAPAAAKGPTFWSGVASSFEKTFIRESRWRLFVQGVLTTLSITVLSILSGTALGFLIFMLCRDGNPAANRVTGVCLWLVRGTPMVVLLMILYYIIFGAVAISGVLVAMIGFTLTFGAGVFGLLKMGVGAVDQGQYEAACALGHSNRQTFFRIILPQAIPHVLPAWKGEIMGLIKATAIVGYIAVQDLTKMGDIVRSRTYEAFFPLIAVTVIYFALEALLGVIVNRISLGFDPRRRKPADILRGVDSDDQD